MASDLPDDDLGLVSIRPRDDEPVALHDQQRLGRLERSLFGYEPEVQRLGRWTLLRPLGRGAMGAVYEAFDRRLDRRVALKALLPDRDRSDHAKVRMLREAQALARISHRHVVQVHEVEEADGQVFLVMELIDGVTLRKWLEAPRNRDELIDHYIQLAHGLAAVHAAGVVHRDVKPDNVLVAEDRVVITDFGLVNATPEAAAEHEVLRGLEPSALAVPLTSEGAVLGTKGYMAPEQFHGGAVDARSDQFSFWVCVYEAFFGELPFRSTTTDALDAEVAVGPSMRPKAGALAPAWLSPMIKRGLSLDPARRFPDMGTVKRALDRRRHLHKRRPAWIGAGLVIGALVLGSLAALNHEDPCTRANEQLEPFWGETRQSMLRTKIEGDGTTARVRAWEDFHRAFDQQAQRWREAWLQDCRAGLRGGNAGDLRMRNARDMCMSRNRLQLSAFSERLALDEVTPDPASVQPMIIDLASMADCSDPEVLRHLLEGGSDEPDPPGADALRAALAQATADEVLGRYDVADHAAAAVADEARSLEASRVLAAALYRRARIVANRGETEAAHALAVEAAELAARYDEPLLAAEAWVFLAKLSANDLRDASLSRVDLAVARQAVIAAGEDVRREWLYADYLEAQGMGAFLERRYEDAEQLHREALTLRVDLLPGSDMRLDIIKSKNNLANVLSRMTGERKAEALTLYEDALGDAQALLEEDHPFNAELWFNIGIQHRDAGRRSEATEAFRRAAQLDRSARGEAGVPALRALLALGDSTEDEHERRMLVGRIEAIHARLLAEDPLAMQHPERAQELKLIARVRLEENDTSATIDALERAATIQESLEPIEHAWTLVDLAGLLAGTDRRHEAMPLLEQALVVLRRDHDPTDEVYLHDAEALLVELAGNPKREANAQPDESNHGDVPLPHPR